jgi:hypothetical protein
MGLGISGAIWSWIIAGLISLVMGVWFLRDHLRLVVFSPMRLILTY